MAEPGAAAAADDDDDPAYWDRLTAALVRAGSKGFPKKEPQVTPPAPPVDSGKFEEDDADVELLLSEIGDKAKLQVQQEVWWHLLWFSGSCFEPRRDLFRGLLSMTARANAGRLMCFNRKKNLCKFLQSHAAVRSAILVGWREVPPVIEVLEQLCRFQCPVALVVYCETDAGLTWAQSRFVGEPWNDMQVILFSDFVPLGGFVSGLVSRLSMIPQRDPTDKTVVGTIPPILNLAPPPPVRPPPGPKEVLPGPIPPGRVVRPLATAQLRAPPGLPHPIRLSENGL